MRTLAATGAGAAVSSCTPTDPGQLIPYLVPPDDSVPGRADWYATTCRECPAGCGVLARVREGRVVKLEGNAEHPINRGALCQRGQAGLQGLYDPDRHRGPALRDGDELRLSDWDTALDRLRADLAGARVGWMGRLETGALGELVDEWLAEMEGSRRVTFEPLAEEAIAAAYESLHGVRAVPTYVLDDADVIVGFGAEFLETWISTVALTAGYGRARALREGERARHVHVSPRRGLTGDNADTWLPVLPGAEALVAATLAAEVLAAGPNGLDEPTWQRARQWLGDRDLATAATVAGIPVERLEELARTLRGARTAVVVGGGVTGGSARARELEIAVALLNLALGAHGTRVRPERAAATGAATPHDDVMDFLDAARTGRFDVVVLHETDPLHALPAGADALAALSAVATVVCLESRPTASTALADMVLPVHHALEDWGDHEAVTGVVGLQQPVMRPLHDSRSIGDVVLSLAGEGGSFHDRVRSRWQRAAGGSGDAWELARRRGGSFVEPPPPAETAELAAVTTPVDFTPPTANERSEDLPLVVFPTVQMYDGRGAVRPWLQESPDPTTKAAWSSWLELHPATAGRLGIGTGDGARLSTADGRTLEVAVLVSEGVRADVAALPLGYGHDTVDGVVGVNPMQLVPATIGAHGLARSTTRVTVAPAGRPMAIPRTQIHDDEEGRHLARFDVAGQPDDGEEEHLGPDLYADHEHPDHRWGMTIDLNACVGCGACEVACVAENNIPVVGAAAVSQGREMSWIRIDRYHTEHGTAFIPMLCQHCDSAPCETVCPVNATYHSDEGLNAMVYNRCVGTRYCSNNCPYKVRRFNWVQARWREPSDLQLNPDVTARSVGVMEKCTFCVQRIQEGKQAARAAGRPVAEGDVVPACAQTCPTRAIVFGDLTDSDHEATWRAADARAYRILEELNTEPAITYLKRVALAERE